MSDGEYLLRAIIDEPAVDAHRLVYADWLDEQGQGERARYVRESIAWPAASFVALTRRDPFLLLGMEPGPPVPVSGWDDDGKPRQVMRTWVWAESDDMGLIVHDLGRDLCYCVDRGFVSAIRCPLKAWLSHGPGIVLAHPVESVKLTRRAIHPATFSRHHMGWLAGPPESVGTLGWLPASLWAVMDAPVAWATVEGVGVVKYRECRDDEHGFAILEAALVPWAKK